MDVHLWLVHFGPLGKQIGKRWAVGDTELGSPMSLYPAWSELAYAAGSAYGGGLGWPRLLSYRDCVVDSGRGAADNRSRAGRPCQLGDDRPIREHRAKRLAEATAQLNSYISPTRGGLVQRPKIVTTTLTGCIVLERMTGIEPALSAWEAGEPTSQVLYQAQIWSFESPVWWLFWRVGARGGPSS